jgi:hypothetical protein
MRQWEHLKLDLNQAPRRGDAIDKLNNAGNEGWELVTVSGTGMATLKREMGQPTKVGRRKATAEGAG